MLGSPRRVGISLKAMARHAPLGVALGLGRGQLGVPQRDEAQRDVVAARGRAPLLDHPVVVGLDAGQAELLVLALVEGLAAEAREGREGQRAVGVVERPGP